jgi:DNA invertase Pin-like site-specific DNA recombinase
MIDAVISDIVSGDDEDRQVLCNALNALRQGDLLVVHRLSRLTRSPSQLKWILRTIHDEGAGLLVVKPGLIAWDITAALLDMAVQAENELKRIRETMAQVIQGRIARGCFHGRIPYGFKRCPRTGKLQSDASESAVIQTMMRLRAGANGKKGKRIADIVKFLNKSRVPSPNGIIGAWSWPTVNRIIKRCCKQTS